MRRCLTCLYLASYLQALPINLYWNTEKHELIIIQPRTKQDIVASYVSYCVFLVYKGGINKFVYIWSNSQPRSRYWGQLFWVYKQTRAPQYMVSILVACELYEFP